MKIMFYTTTMRKGGGERVIANLANFFSENNDVLIASALNVEPEYQLKDKVKLIKIEPKQEDKKKLKIFDRISYKKFIELKKCIDENQPDMIISFFPEPCFRILALRMLHKKIRKIPIIISERNDPKREYRNFIIKWLANFLYSKADGIVFQTEEAKEFFCKKIQEKSTIIPNPINPQFDREAYDGIREKRIVAVGRLTPQKNHKVLMGAFKNLNRKDYTLHIYGEGGLHKELEKYIEEIGMQENIFLEGKKDDIISEIYKAEMFVLSSNYEGMPNALMEAMTLGLACISTDCSCGGPRYLIENETNGLLVNVNDVEDLTRAMIKVIQDKELAKRMGENAQKSMREFTPDKICQKWFEFMNLTNEKRK